jgi:RNA polymerase sigma factor (sigma-70 family)
LETYLREINETALLTANEEKELSRAITAGSNEARDRMVRANLRLVVNIARAYGNKGLPLQDLIEEGNLGLLRAVEGFDPTMGTRFSTYASYWIKQSIKRALVNTGRTEIHRAARVDHQTTSQVRIGLELFDIEAIGSSIRAPIEPPQIVAGDILSILGKFDARPAMRARMTPRHIPLHRPPRHQRHRRQSRKDAGIEKATRLTIGKHQSSPAMSSP